MENWTDSKSYDKREDNKAINSCDLPPGTRVWLYARHSPEDNQTINAQLAKLVHFVKEKEWIVDQIFKDERVNDYTIHNRADFEQMRHLCRYGPHTAKVILITELSRFSKYPVEAYLIRNQMQRDGWQILPLMDNIPANFAYPSIETVHKDKTVYGLRYIAEQGCVPGGKIAKGYIVTKKLIGYHRYGTMRQGRKPEPDPKIVQLIVRAFQMKARGLPYTLIAQETGLYGPKDTGSWNHMFSNRVYIGEYEFHGQIYRNVYPAIISEELFEAVQKQLPERKHKQWKLKGGPKQDHPRRKGSNFFLANISVCKYCGAAMEGKSDSRGRFYVCSQRNERSALCPEANLINAEVVEEKLLQILEVQILKPEFVQDLLDWTNCSLNTGLEELQLLLQRMEKEFLEAKRLADAMARNFVACTQERSWALEKPIHDQEKLIENLEIQMEALRAEIFRRHIKVNQTEVEEYLQHLEKLIKAATHFDKREVVEQLCSRIIMDAEECVVELKLFHTKLPTIRCSFKKA